MSETYEINGANVDLTSPPEGGTEWTVQQKNLELEIEYPKNHSKISFHYGPIKLVDGYVDTDTLDIVVAPVVAQVYLGIISGNIKDDVSVRVNLSDSHGHLRFYLKHGNEIWLDFSVGIHFGGSYSAERKILSL